MPATIRRKKNAVDIAIRLWHLAYRALKNSRDGASREYREHLHKEYRKAKVKAVAALAAEEGEQYSDKTGTYFLAKDREPKSKYPVYPSWRPSEVRG